MTSGLLMLGGGLWSCMGSGLLGCSQGGEGLLGVGVGLDVGERRLVKKVEVAWSMPAGSVLGGWLGCRGCLSCWSGGISEVCGCW